MKGSPQFPGQLDMSGATLEQRLYEGAIELLRIAEPPEGYYLATSFGKDSIVIQRLCDEAGVKYDAHTNVTGVDPPELIRFGREHYPDVVRERRRSANGLPVTMWSLIKENGMPPLRWARYCCASLKEGGGAGRTCVMGIRAEESDRRKNIWGPYTVQGKRKADNVRMFDNDDIAQVITQCMARDGIFISPLYNWTSEILWNFIHDRQMSYCSLYDEGHDRLGCILCPMASKEQKRRDAERWPGFYKLYLRAFQKLIDAGRMTNFESAEAIMEWWIGGKAQERAEIDWQVGLFDGVDREEKSK